MKEAYLGIDCGNKSLKAVLLSKEKELIDWVYLDNLGVIKTLTEAFERLNHRDLTIAGIGSCGTGREFISRLLDADIVKTEIISSYKGCREFLNRDSFTAFDIGGEDCKILVAEKGLIRDFVMNQACSANLGVYLENVSHRLGVRIEDFGKLALKSANPLSISSRCGILGISSCASLLNQGARIEDILSGVARSVVRNFLSIYTKKITPPFIFTGGVALNQAVCYWLEKELKDSITIPENPLIVSATGVAILTLEDKPRREFFLGEFLDRKIDVQAFNCTDCENNCQINQLVEDKIVKANFGSRCGKYK